MALQPGSYERLEASVRIELSETVACGAKKRGGRSRLNMPSEKIRPVRYSAVTSQKRRRTEQNGARLGDTNPRGAETTVRPRRLHEVHFG